MSAVVAERALYAISDPRRSWTWTLKDLSKCRRASLSLCLQLGCGGRFGHSARDVGPADRAPAGRANGPRAASRTALERCAPHVLKKRRTNTAHSTLSLTPLSCARFLLFLHTTDHRRRGRPQLPLALPGPHHHPHPARGSAGAGRRPAAAGLHRLRRLPQPLPRRRAADWRHRHLADWRLLRAQPAAAGRRVARGRSGPAVHGAHAGAAARHAAYAQAARRGRAAHGGRVMIIISVACGMRGYCVGDNANAGGESVAKRDKRDRGCSMGRSRSNVLSTEFYNEIYPPSRARTCNLKKIELYGSLPLACRTRISRINSPAR